VCSLCLSGYIMGVFSDDVGWLAFFVWRSPAGVEGHKRKRVGLSGHSCLTSTMHGTATGTPFRSKVT
jgi:hypothetical protein